MLTYVLKCQWHSTAMTLKVDATSEWAAHAKAGKIIRKLDGGDVLVLIKTLSTR